MSCFPLPVPELSCTISKFYEGLAFLRHMYYVACSFSCLSTSIGPHAVIHESDDHTEHGELCITLHTPYFEVCY